MRLFHHSTAGQASYGSPRHERRTLFSARTIVFFFLFFISAIGWLYVLFGSEAFVVNAVEVRGVKSLDPGEVGREVFAVLDGREEWRPWSPRHRWFVDPKKVEQTLEQRLFASRVVVDNLDTNVLRLLVEERGNRAVFYSGQQYFWVDLQGVVTEELSLAEKKRAQARILGHRLPLSDDPPLIHQDLPELIAPGSHVASAELMRSTIQHAHDLMAAGIAYREIQWPRTPTSTTETIISPEGFSILMDVSEDLQIQIATYKAFWEAQKKPPEVAEYIDAQIPGRIYVK
jgi:hypothetical protein